MDTARQVLQFNREVGILHLAGQGIFEASLEAYGRKDVQFVLGK